MADLSAKSFAVMSANPQTDPFLQQFEDIIQTIQRDINVLGEPTSDRSAKRRALEHIQSETLLKKPALNPQVLFKVFSSITRSTLRAVSDPVEKCRELSITIISGFVKNVDDVIPFLPYIIPTFTSRLAQPEIVEPAEELRLLMTQALLDIVKKSRHGFAPFVEDTIKILARTLMDTYPEVKKESCRLVIELCKFNVKPVAFHGDALAKAVLPVLHHRHSSVRIIAIEAIGAAILVDAKGLDDCLDTLRSMSMDKAPLVRETLYTIAHKWMLELIDRYTYGYKILPLLLCGMTDDMPKLRAMSVKFMDEIGALYETEWESRIKDEMDYTDGWSHLPIHWLTLAFQFPDRPRVGSRHLARDNMQKVVAKIVEGMGNWTVEVRIKSAQMLGAYLTLTEDQITGYVGVILPILYKILSGDDPLVMEEAARVASILGNYVNADATLSLLLPQLAMGGGSTTSFRLGCSRTLHGLIHGASTTISAHASRIVDALADKDLVLNENMLILYEISRCVCELLLKVTTIDQDVSFKVLMILAQLESVVGDENMPGYINMQKKTNESLVRLSSLCQVSNVESLYGLFFENAIDTLTATHTSWTKHSAELRVLETVVLRVGVAIEPHLSKILPLVCYCASKERDYEVRKSVLLLMIKLVQVLKASPSSGRALSNDSETLLREPRLNSVQADEQECVGFLNVSLLNTTLERDLLPILISNIEDDEIATRITSLKVLSTLLDSDIDWNGSTLKKLYPELLKRLDDAQDKIRVQCANIWPVYFNSVCRWLAKMASSYPIDTTNKLTSIPGADGGVVEIALDTVHWQTMIKGLTIHLDDTNPDIQDAILNALKAGAQKCIPKEMLSEHLHSVRAKHRTTRYIDDILLLVG
ncbi:hypothetical protein BDEG_20113 [Batrachochytrium dendrobatidis JEL423]|uniref:TOG domain-containing protein n=1 Tax=Batrachochytrium dendrobatidis (strain JEL423) TaxID=403673 RepID=A0A177W838_BATDL|nr:hypothetical protein BDEG_20113 [Batrachochytrium dendrobatidis JEL423]